MGLFKRSPALASAHDKGNATPALSVTEQRLQQLNFDFLKLLIAGSQHGSSLNPISRTQLSLPTVQAVTLANCSDDALRLMSAVGFSLFTYDFHHVDFWERLAAKTANRSAIQRYAAETGEATESAASVEAAYSGYAECALFFAWHMAQHEATEARLMLGMREETAAILAPLETWQCRLMAQRSYQTLTPRWSQNPYFWVDLLRYGTTRDEQHFRFVRLMGTQLIAKDLEPSALFRVTPEEKKG